jgi:hypothetical protein
METIFNHAPADLKTRSAIINSLLGSRGPNFFPPVGVVVAVVAAVVVVVVAVLVVVDLDI